MVNGERTRVPACARTAVEVQLVGVPVCLPVCRVDVDAEGNNPFQPSNFIAGIGDAWDGAPNGIADSYIQDNGVNHEDFQSMMNASGPGVNSPAQVLAGSPTVSAPFLPGR